LVTWQTFLIYGIKIKKWFSMCQLRIKFDKRWWTYSDQDTKKKSARSAIFYGNPCDISE
jgi:hypothetical protein